MDFIKKNLSNIIFFAFIIFLFTPYGLPVRALLIKGVSYVTTRVFNMEIDESERVDLSTYNWNLSDTQGNAVDFNDYKGKVVLVNFWATWCPPCVAEMPSYQDLYNDYKDKMEFVFVASDDQGKVMKFLADKGYKLPVYFQTSKAPEELRSNSLPTTFIIDKKGRIVVDKTGAADWNSGKVRDMLDDLINN
ncbi:MAG: TlpA family protein disulfide reductase [Flavobacteriia bacterium]|nr:MAG: TlpA family protein disulfide reductase [Flavobacteriia bacterium]